MSDEPRAYTKDEVLAHFIAEIEEKAHYWANTPGDPEHPLTVQDRCHGVAFSILCLLDGVTGFPAVNLSLSVNPTDKEFHIEEDENWYEPDMSFADNVMLHDMLKTRR